MTRDCKKLLNEFKKISGNTTLELARVVTMDDSVVISPANKYSKKFYHDLSHFKDQYDAHFDELLKCGYIVETRPYFFRLTEKGLHPYYYAFHGSFSTFVRAIIAPIIVTVIAAIIVWILQA